MARKGAPAVLCGRAELIGLFEGLDLAEPDVVSCWRWRPDIIGLGQSPDMPHFCGVGRTWPKNHSAYTH